MEPGTVPVSQSSPWIKKFIQLNPQAGIQGLNRENVGGLFIYTSLVQTGTHVAEVEVFFGHGKHNGSSYLQKIKLIEIKDHLSISHCNVISRTFC